MALTILEESAPFSDSMLWKLQREAYTGFGVSAWSEKGVPNYLTSHPLTAHGYAKTALGFLKDLFNDKPVTIYDFGAGTGKFAYLFLKEFLPKVDVPVQYIATDITEENLNFIRTHPMMQSQGVLKCALYRHDDIEWQQKMAPVEGPVIVITNYYFDTVPQTLYRVENGKLFEGKITLSIDDAYNTGGVEMIPHLQCAYTYHPIEASPLLKEYASILQHGNFIVPTGGLKTIEFVRKHVKGPLLWISADQGVCTLNQARNFQEPKIARHGTFSVTVSYHFLHWYFQQHLDGTVLMTDNPDPAYAVMAAVLGCEGCPNTAAAFRDTINAFEPIDYYRISEALEASDPSLDAIMALVRAGHWDPINTHLFFDRIRSKMQAADADTKDRLVYMLERVRENFYPISKEEGEFIMNLGVLFFELHDFPKALYCFERSLIFTGPSTKTQLNISACRLKLNL